MSLLLHEIGHGIGTVLFSDNHAYIYLGSYEESNKETFHVGRIHFHIQYAFNGWCEWGTGLSKGQRLIALLSRPLMSFIIMSGTVLILNVTPAGFGRKLLLGFADVNLFLLIFTILPFQLPQWLGERFSFPSDGLQILRLLKKEQPLEE